MQKHLLHRVSPGSIVAQDIYSDDGILLLKKGSAYRQHYTVRFKEAGVHEVYIEDDGSMSRASIEEIRQSLKIKDIIYERTKLHAQAQMKKMMVRFRSLGHSDIRRISSIVEEIIDQLFLQKDFVFSLSQLRAVDDYTYHHSVNVGVLSLIIGIEVGLEKEALMKLGMGAILHDIGKVMIPEDILNKPTRLTAEEYAEVKKHTVYGYKIMKEAGMSEDSALIALHHHEKYDGSGYTFGLEKKKIPLFARIVAVADVYDAMSNDRVYQKRSTPDKVYREITHLGDKHFDKDIMESFAKHICIYPTGTGVILNTGHRGIVLEQNKLYPESPMVRVFTPETKHYKSLYFDVDLSFDTKYRIVDAY